MDLWLSPHDARVRSLRSEGKLLYGYGMTPFGECIALTTGEHLLALRFVETRAMALKSLQKEWSALTLHRSPETDSLIERALDRPEAIPLLATGTPFQLSVWKYLRQNIGAVTLTYGEVAEAIGRPKAARAVGQAVGANGIALLIPCHRVVSRGKLTGYRWGLERKRKILDWELSTHVPLEMPF